MQRRESTEDHFTVEREGCVAESFSASEERETRCGARRVAYSFFSGAAAFSAFLAGAAAASFGASTTARV